MTRPLVLLSFAFAVAVPLACGGGGKPASSGGGGGGGGGGETTPKVIVEDSTETWYEETSGKPGEKGTGIREYVLDVTKRVEWKGGGGTLLDAGAPPPDRIYRIAVRFPVPKVSPDGARDPHVVNRLLWDVRKEIAKCWYKGGGKEPGEESSMVGWMTVSKEGKVTGSGVEKADEPLTKTGAADCIMENVKDMTFSAAGDETKIRFKLKLQTMDVTGKADAMVAPASSAK